MSSAEEAVGIAISLVWALGGQTVPARLADDRTLLIDLSSGEGEPLLPVVAAEGAARMRLEATLPRFLEDARHVVEWLRRTERLADDAETDALTGLLNRASIERILPRLVSVWRDVRPHPVGVSVGFAEVDDAGGRRAPERPDQALLRAKRSGRDRVESRRESRRRLRMPGLRYGRVVSRASRTGTIGEHEVELFVSMPSEEVGRYLSAIRPVAMGISCTVPLHFGGVTRMSEQAHEVGIPVVVGGRALGSDSERGADRLAARVG